MHPLSLNDWLVMTKAPPVLPTLEDYPQTLRREATLNGLKWPTRRGLKPRQKAEKHTTAVTAASMGTGQTGTRKQGHV